VIDYVRCYMNITSHRPMVMYQGRALEAFDAVIPRIGASQTFYGTAVVRQFEMMGSIPQTNHRRSRARATSCAACSSSRGKASAFP
jgi:ribosomal protein S6--L-glutamate ligase